MSPESHGNTVFVREGTRRGAKNTSLMKYKVLARGGEWGARGGARRHNSMAWTHMWRHPLDAETGCKYNVPALKGVSSAEWIKAGALGTSVRSPVNSRPSHVARRVAE